MEQDDLEMEIVQAEDDEDDDDDDDDDDDANDIEENDDLTVDNKTKTAGKTTKKVYLPGEALAKDVELICDESAYIMFHQASTGAPCLSFDFLPDDLGDRREEYPHTLYLVAGTQAARTHVNNVVVMKMYNLHKTKPDDNDDDDDDDEELEDDEDDVQNKSSSKLPQMSAALIKHKGCVNRIRAQRVGNSLCAASWSELGRVNIWNITRQMQAVEDEQLRKQYEREIEKEPVQPLYSFSGHQQEGYAIDWSHCASGVLATGDCKRDIHIWSPLEAGTWKVDQRPLIGHTASVEDLQWSPNEASVLASCSIDKSIRIWDCRAAPQKACMLTCDNAHESDINVISWNRVEPFIASGGDDGYLHIWDLRQFQTKKPIATFKHHTDHITTIEWNPCDATVLASAGDDDQLVQWDLSVEKDQDQETKQQNVDDELNKLPPQLLFMHMGQKEIKELHWHPQIPGVILSTAQTGLNIFRTVSV